MCVLYVSISVDYLLNIMACFVVQTVQDLCSVLVNSSIILAQ